MSQVVKTRLRVARDVNLPVPTIPVFFLKPPTALIGREAEVAAATALLDPLHSAVRLLTLVGPGGGGQDPPGAGRCEYPGRCLPRRGGLRRLGPSARPAALPSARRSE